MSTLNKLLLPTTRETFAPLLGPLLPSRKLTCATTVMTMIPMLTLMNPSSFPLNSVPGSLATLENMMFRSAVVILMMMSAIPSGLLMTPMKVLNEIVLGARLNTPVQEIVGEKRDQLKRGTYDYTNQPIPGFNSVTSSDDWDHAVFYYTPYTSSITAPYCGYGEN